MGTLDEIESFHSFLMKDLFREEKAINFEYSLHKGRESDKKYYIVPLKLDTADEEMKGED